MTKKTKSAIAWSENSEEPTLKNILDHCVLEEDAMKLDGLDKAIIGVDTKGYLVYDYQKIVDVFTKAPHNMEYEEAIEFTDFNVVGLDGNGNWTIMYNKEYYA